MRDILVGTFRSEFDTKTAKEIGAKLCLRSERIFAKHVNLFMDSNDNSHLKEPEDFLAEKYLKELFEKYPVFKKDFKSHEYNLSCLYEEIKTRYFRDEPFSVKGIMNGSPIIEDISVGVGDFHNGRSTAILSLSNKNKIVYKPTSGSITKAYNKFIAWLTEYLPIGKSTFEVLDKGSYQWMEYIDQQPCTTIEQISTYYERCGHLLCVLYLFNGSDYHFENVIANGSSPALIDHETLIQPKINKHLKKYFQLLHNEHEDTVYDSMLLPNKNVMKTLPPGMCGFGWHKQKVFFGLAREGINRFTEDWKMVTLTKTLNLYKNNIPLLENNRIYPGDYIKQLIRGFNKCYHALLEMRSELLSSTTIFNEFNSSELRYIWRPTNVYVKILDKLKLPENLVSFSRYENLLKGYLKVAYKNVPANSSLWLLYEHELTQMLRGDIPVFKINSNSRDLITENGVIHNFFDLSCIENLNRKLKKFSKKDMYWQNHLIHSSFK